MSSRGSVSSRKSSCFPNKIHSSISVLGVGHMANMYGLNRKALVCVLKVLELNVSIKMSRLLKFVGVEVCVYVLIVVETLLVYVRLNLDR